MKIRDALYETKNSGKVPTVIAYNRIDGPGSTIDIKEYQISMWHADVVPDDYFADPSMSWSKGLPRTVSATIDTGTKIEAHPLEEGYVGVESVDFKFRYVKRFGDVPITRKYWLLKIIENFGIDGVIFKLENTSENALCSSLGGSGSVTAGVAILANELSGRRFSSEQIIGMSSEIENSFGVSITGTQDQASVLYGGVSDYIWFPWGIINSSKNTSSYGYGSSIKTRLVEPCDFKDLESRIALFPIKRKAKRANNTKVWMKRLRDENGFKIQKKLCEIAYSYREGIRQRDWKEVKNAIRDYGKIRESLCRDYMTGEYEMIRKICSEHNAAIFPLGSGGGSVTIFCNEPYELTSVIKRLSKEIECSPMAFKIQPRGHEISNISEYELLNRRH